MALDPSIILAGQAPNIIGAIDAGNTAGQRRNEFMRQNALNSFLQQNGPGVIAGDQNALAGLARFDLMAALGVQDTRQQMAARDQQMTMLTAQEQRIVEDRARAMTAEQRAQEAAQIQQGVAAGLAAQTPEEWDAIVTQFGAPDLVGQFANRQAVAMRYMSVADALGRMDEQAAAAAFNPDRYRNVGESLVDLGGAGGPVPVDLGATVAADPMDEIKLERERLALEQDRIALEQARNPTPDAPDSADLRDTWEKLPAVREFQSQASAFSRVAASAQLENAAGDMALIFGVMKMLDPASTVREGEAAQAAQAPGVSATILGEYNRAINGQVLTEERRQELFNMAIQQYKAAEASVGRVRTQYEQTALRSGLNPDEVLTDYRYNTGARGSLPFSMTRPQARSGQVSQPAAQPVVAPVQAAPQASIEPTTMPTANTAPSPVPEGPEIPPPPRILQARTFVRAAAERGLTPEEFWAGLPIEQKQALAGQ